MAQAGSLSAEKRALLERRLRGAYRSQADAPRIAKRAGDAPAPLSFAQSQMWVIDRRTPGNPAYNLPFGYRLRGRLDKAALEESLNDIVERHDALRTSFTLSGGEPCQ